MNTSTTTELFQQLDNIFEIITLIKNAGFDCYDYSFMMRDSKGHPKNILFCRDFLKKAAEIRYFSDKLGISCNQSHAPFPSFFPNNPEASKRMIFYIKRSIKIASILGAKIIVVHPWNNFTAEENFSLYSKIAPIAKKCHIKIGVENMWNWKQGESSASAASCSHPDDFLKHMNLLEEHYPGVFVACVDIGHAEMFKDVGAYKLIKTLGKYVGAIHVHDNDKIHDCHEMPFTMKIDFDKVVSALREIKYKGDMTMEVIVRNGVTIENLEAYSKQLSYVANQLKEKFLK